MTVGKLIEKLSKYDPDAEVVFTGSRLKDRCIPGSVECYKSMGDPTFIKEGRANFPNIVEVYTKVERYNPREA